MTEAATRLTCPPPQRDSGTASVEVPAAALAAVLDALPQPLLLVDARAVIRHLNRAGADLLRRGHVLRARNQLLIAADNGETHALQRAIARVAAGRERHVLLALTPASRDADVAVRLWRVATPALPFVALSTGASVTECLDLGAVRQLYGLTAAEARVAALVAAGRPLSEIAAELQIGRSTVRTHLQRVLAKTGAGRQSALASLLLSGPGLLRLPHEPDGTLTARVTHTPLRAHLPIRAHDRRTKGGTGESEDPR